MSHSRKLTEPNLLGVHENLWSIAGKSEAQVTAKTLHWRLICVCTNKCGWGKEGHSCRAEPFTYGFWCYLQLDGVRIELNYNTSSCCWTIWRYIVKKKKTTLHLSEFGTRLLRTQLLWKLESCWEFSQGLATYWVSPATLQIAVRLCPSDPMTKSILSCPVIFYHVGIWMLEWGL